MEMVLKDLEGKFGIKLDVFNTPNYVDLQELKYLKKRGVKESEQK